MLISAAVCPHPPILVPAMAGEAARERDGLRAACDEAVGRLAAALPDALVVVGGAPGTAVHRSDAHATLRPYGLPWTSPDVPGEGSEPLPLSLTIGRWLIERYGDPAVQETGYRSVAFDASPEECLAIGRDVAASADRVGLLVMGDGSACRSEKAPGYLDERAEAYDEAVARALGDADAAALAALDPGTSRELRAAGRAAWQVLAGAAGTGRFGGELLADEAPYGVAYFVASWSAARPGHEQAGPGL
ncbi:hypothetical protein BJF79_10805 [Actinomadura sp. CNU-125]|uniref:class III extradiol dioxygenase subunit B-like domain-containing protein n=1 Tax=Actinomadura sp. CNU-125 TaxID=1904961 RepID=UPI000963CD50|nr:class III extradiol dioxygenase subunit B-like domain-containing protein [Actinomadura sp. CNU-125]OLT28977.1 hypothetical protein BJF79_10805 [Actinomadura sp. CNU-125]